MKKFLITILALVYLTSTFGATLRLDCCLQNLVHVGLGTLGQEHQWLNEAKDNCKDEHNQVKLVHEQKHSDSKIRISKYVPPSLNTAYPDYSFHSTATLTAANQVNNALSKQALIPLFILNCVHRI
ncbi:hypothetical protein A3860_07460 [Niastella vici]|uniref:SCP domain-containing protein n=1 Tax=Niastella vici TaxID=1703345 RepID=A0A1V9FIX3_9BACT|nr:hypothetical protein [Niastella vici]OQP58156.1 hypothetical protein A3860_07460 [Niastella vici]